MIQNEMHTIDVDLNLDNRVEKYKNSARKSKL